MDRIHPSVITQKTESITKMLREIFSLKSKDEIKKRQVQIESKLEEMENIELLQEYCNNVRDILKVFTNDPSEQSGSNSLLRLLDLNEKLRIEIIQKLNLCSEPDY